MACACRRASLSRAVICGTPALRCSSRARWIARRDTRCLFQGPDGAPECRFDVLAERGKQGVDRERVASVAPESGPAIVVELKKYSVALGHANRDGFAIPS